MGRFLYQQSARWPLAAALVMMVGCTDGNVADPPPTSPPDSGGLHDAAGDARDADARPSFTVPPSVLSLWGTGPANVWAAGFSGSLMHWDGVAWTRRQTNIRGSLAAIWDDGTGHLLAVEDQWFDAGHQGRLVRGDGSQFDVVETGAVPDEIPRDLWGNGSDDVWLVGRVGDDPAVSFGFARHFDGTKWSSFGSFGERLVGAWGTRREMFLVGASAGGFVAHWIDGTWAAPAYPGPALIDVWGANPTDVWAVGAGSQVIHYNGTSWSLVNGGANDGSMILMAVWGSSSRDVWAVGYRGNPATGVMLHWDGNQWSVAPDSPRETLYAIWGSSADDIWVGGTNVLLHFEGGTWRRVSGGEIR